jgi:penicillin-binding protein 1C
MKRRRLVSLASGTVIVGIMVAAVDRLAPPDLTRFQRASVTVTDSEGQLLRPFLAPDHAWRLPVDAAGVDPLYVAMLRDKEDRRFGLHPGIDPLAAFRAAAQWATHGRVVSGASTITMQVARLLEPRPRTIAAKLVESWRALQLQARLGSDGVLGAYLTLAPFGSNLEGLRAGALAWFGKEPARLSPAEAALLVALPQSPERLRPDRHPEAARQARDRVLDRAQAAGLLPADAVAQAKAQPAPSHATPSSAFERAPGA